ncbi:hypothetical protein P22_1994 [Propionispora sp. 2/2-37]|uniref:DUF2800 domain-containing protein n=1 Tax=Propionispora sp. 2/2-37 TaxID=1677858 RepID=UPI0006C6A4C1|nr:DUF2800 domain-containing protein [Propionispora sp. 2/2-37]CUH95908.1 hypothetical protein P22_1994 [Propionispora sp. 2/2-37]
MAHALLSASSSKRWLNCPPSARIETQFPESSSPYADEGTFAHSLGELKLRKYTTVMRKSEYDNELHNLMKNQYYSKELEDHIDNYVDFVKEKIHEADSRNPGEKANVLLEQKLDYSLWVPEGFGTGDVVIITSGYLDIIDLKYGKGVPVSAEGNTQLQLYALGAYNNFSMLYDIHTVRMTIHQPRLDSISSQEMPIFELLAWADSEVRPKAELAFKGEGELCCGDWCRFCRAKATCRARAEDSLELTRLDFKKPPLLTQEEIAEILEKAEQIQAWASDVQAYALDQAENHGVKWPGWKLVEGRSNRKYKDDSIVADELLIAGYSEEQIYNKKLLGITDMEKLLGKKNFEAVIGAYIIKPPGKPVLVVESDKRPELNSSAKAAQEFGVFAGTKNMKEQHDKVKKVIGA